MIEYCYVIALNLVEVYNTQRIMSHIDLIYQELTCDHFIIIRYQSDTLYLVSDGFSEQQRLFHEVLIM